MVEEERVYETDPSENYSRTWALEELQSGDPQRIGRENFYSAINDPDWKWVQETCLNFVESKIEHIQEMAIMSLGHLARVNQIDLRLIIPILINKLEHRSTNVRSASKYAISDIRVFCIPEQYSRNNILNAIASNDVAFIVVGIFDMARRDADKNFALSKCIELSGHDHFAVREAALSGIGELLWENDFVSLVAPILRSSIADPHPVVRESVESVISCIKTFHGVDV